MANEIISPTDYSSNLQTYGRHYTCVDLVHSQNPRFIAVKHYTNKVTKGRLFTLASCALNQTGESFTMTMPEGLTYAEKDWLKVPRSRWPNSSRTDAWAKGTPSYSIWKEEYNESSMQDRTYKHETQDICFKLSVLAAMPDTCLFGNTVYVNDACTKV